jgi:hypothetical protein
MPNFSNTTLPVRCVKILYAFLVSYILATIVLDTGAAIAQSVL